MYDKLCMIYLKKKAWLKKQSRIESHLSFSHKYNTINSFVVTNDPIRILSNICDGVFCKIS